MSGHNPAATKFSGLNFDSPAKTGVRIQGSPKPMRFCRLDGCATFEKSLFSFVNKTCNAPLAWTDTCPGRQRHICSFRRSSWLGVSFLRFTLQVLFTQDDRPFSNVKRPRGDKNALVFGSLQCFFTKSNRVRMKRKAQLKYQTYSALRLNFTQLPNNTYTHCRKHGHFCLYKCEHKKYISKRKTN